MPDRRVKWRLFAVGAVVLVLGLYLLTAALGDQEIRQAALDDACTADPCPQAGLRWIPAGVAHLVGLTLVFIALRPLWAPGRRELASSDRIAPGDGR